jgi:hypothetical protein
MTGVRVDPATEEAECLPGRITAISTKTDRRLSVHPAKRDFIENLPNQQSI